MHFEIFSTWKQVYRKIKWFAEWDVKGKKCAYSDSTLSFGCLKREGRANWALEKRIRMGIIRFICLSFHLIHLKSNSATFIYHWKCIKRMDGQWIAHQLVGFFGSTPKNETKKIVSMKKIKPILRNIKMYFNLLWPYINEN